MWTSHKEIRCFFIKGHVPKVSRASRYPKGLKSELQGDLLFVPRHFQPLRQFGTEEEPLRPALCLPFVGVGLRKPVNTAYSRKRPSSKKEPPSWRGRPGTEPQDDPQEVLTQAVAQGRLGSLGLQSPRQSTPPPEKDLSAAPQRVFSL